MNTGNRGRTLRVQVMVWLLLALAVPRLAEAGSNGSQKAVGPEAQQKLARVQIPFMANQGQGDKEVKFTARTFAGTVSVIETGELVYSFPKVEDKKQVKGVSLKEELIGGKVTEVKGESRAVTKLNYFKGNDRSKWQSNIPSYDVVNLGEVYEGIDFKLKAYGNNVEKLFYVKPGAEPESIKIKLSGGKELRVNDSGELEVETEQGTVRFSKPVAFQEDGGEKEFVEAAYVVRGNAYGFNVGDYDRTRKLVIDPILAATFLGGNSGDQVSALAFDSTGNVYVAGSTLSADFPGVGAGSADSILVAGGEAFVARLNSDLSTILAATFLGGRQYMGLPGLVSLAIDSDGNVYVAGGTESTDFPGVGPGSADSTFDGRTEGFVAKLNSDLSAILAATFLGGGGNPFAYDMPFALALDSTRNVYVVGMTGSSDFPGVGPESADSTLAGCCEEGFVAKLNADLSSILAATFLGGQQGAVAEALALDSSGNVFVAGVTGSADFPGVGPGSADTSIGLDEGFVAKLNPDLSTILAATFLGGSKSESADALALDSTGNVYVSGVTDSADFPGVGPGSADTSPGDLIGLGEGFVAKLNPDLSTILAATFLGGSSYDGALALALDSTGNVYVSGTTGSADFPGIGPGSADSTFAGREGFVAKVNADLSAILAATFLGGRLFGGLPGHVPLAIDSDGNVYVGGATDSTDFPGVGPGSADSTFDGHTEGFVAKLDSNLSSGLQIINDKVSFVVQTTAFNPTSVSGGPAGTFTVNAVLTNKSTKTIREPIKASLRTLTNGNKLLTATEGNGGVGSKQAIDAGSDDILSPNESATVQFRIGLSNRNRFDFFVDVLGTLSP